MAQTSTSVTNPPKQYTFKQLEQLWIKNGGPSYAAPIMAAIALAESNGIPSRTGHDQNNTVDRGLWQINSVHGYGLSSYDPNKNAQQAVSLFKSGGLSQWSTYNNHKWLIPLKKNVSSGDYQNLTEFAKGLSGGHSKIKGVPGVTPIISGVTNTAITGTGDILHPQRVLGGIGGAIEDAVTLGLKEGMYALAILGGGMLILLGLLFIGVDVGLSGLSNRATNHPVVKIANRATPKRGSGTGPTVEDTSSSSLPGPEA